MTSFNDLAFTIMLPAGMLGKWAGDSAVDSMLRRIATAASKDPDGDWADKYGTRYEDDVFMMHPYCWCEREDCPWCASCDCDEHYMVDGAEVDYAAWCAAYNPADDSRRSIAVDGTCAYCTGTGPCAPWGKRTAAPNFLHKPSGYMVRWHKYIGRDVEENRALTIAEMQQIEADCMRAIAAARGAS